MSAAPRHGGSWPTERVLLRSGPFVPKGKAGRTVLLYDGREGNLLGPWVDLITMHHGELEHDAGAFLTVHDDAASPWVGIGSSAGSKDVDFERSAWITRAAAPAVRGVA